MVRVCLSAWIFSHNLMRCFEDGLEPMAILFVLGASMIRFIVNVQLLSDSMAPRWVFRIGEIFEKMRGTRSWDLGKCI